MEDYKPHFADKQRCIQKAELMQQEMHDFIDATMKRTGCGYQDAANTYMLLKLAETDEHIGMAVRLSDSNY